jgi:hypothetical protein
MSLLASRKIAMPLLDPGDALKVSLQSKMIIWTSALAIGLGVAVVASMLQPAGPIHHPGALPTSSIREPASIGAAPYATLSFANSIQAVDFKLPCSVTESGAKTSLAANVKQLRLTGETCALKPKAELLKSEILNTSNGFSATVFVAGPRSFTTDYISLSDGTNALRIKHYFKDGSTSDSSLEINRSPASVQNE